LRSQLQKMQLATIPLAVFTKAVLHSSVYRRNLLNTVQCRFCSKCTFTKAKILPDEVDYTYSVLLSADSQL
jgi:hypothetical protein